MAFVCDSLIFSYWTHDAFLPQHQTNTRPNNHQKKRKGIKMNRWRLDTHHNGTSINISIEYSRSSVYKSWCYIEGNPLLPTDAYHKAWTVLQVVRWLRVWQHPSLISRKSNKTLLQTVYTVHIAIYAHSSRWKIRPPTVFHWTLLKIKSQNHQQPQQQRHQ